MGIRQREKKGENPSEADRREKWTDQVHHTWQIDGKEHIEISDGKAISWLQIADEGSGSLLASEVAEVEVMTQWPQSKACKVVEKAFKRWTLPQRIKIDNGLPFVNAKTRDIPTMAILWWVGMGIEVVQNTPGRPQENGIVENLQGTTYRWVNPAKYETPAQLQQALDQICQRQREVYRIRRKGDKTRKELYPMLTENPRPYRRHDFCIKRVQQYLAQFLWQRKALSNGRVKCFGKYLPIGKKWAGNTVAIIFDPELNAWIISLPECGTQVNIVPNKWINKKEIFQTIGF